EKSLKLALGGFPKSSPFSALRVSHFLWPDQSIQLKTFRPRYGIRCAAIAPGYLQTEMTAAMRPEILDKITAQVPLKRLGLMSEIASTVSFIINNDFVNGKIIEVDGGLRV
ncbi:MAG: SDR family oxidoreductase, partial [Lentisphaeria bacterium]